MSVYTIFIVGVPTPIELEGEEGRAIHDKFIRGEYGPNQRVGIGNLVVRAEHIAAVRTEHRQP